jgi:hypothetical protein
LGFSGRGTPAGLIEATDRLTTANGEKVNRNLALQYADADRNLARALELARAESEVRPVFDLRNAPLARSALEQLNP